MRTLSILRALAVAAVLSAPLAQVAMAQAVDQQQAEVPNGNGSAGSFTGGGPYSNSQLAPTVGD